MTEWTLYSRTPNVILLSNALTATADLETRIEIERVRHVSEYQDDAQSPETPLKNLDQYSDQHHAAPPDRASCRSTAWCSCCAQEEHVRARGMCGMQRQVIVVCAGQQGAEQYRERWQVAPRIKRVSAPNQTSLHVNPRHTSRPQASARRKRQLNGPASEGDEKPGCLSHYHEPNSMQDQPSGHRLPHHKRHIGGAAPHGGAVPRRCHKHPYQSSACGRARHKPPRRPRTRPAPPPVARVQRVPSRSARLAFPAPPHADRPGETSTVGVSKRAA